MSLLNFFGMFSFQVSFFNPSFPRDFHVKSASWRHHNNQVRQQQNILKCSLSHDSGNDTLSDLPALPPVVSDYTLTRVIGRATASRAVIYEATRNDGDDVDDQIFVIKALSIHSLSSWDALDNLNYEASFLKRNLVNPHPNIPTFVDYFQHQSESDCVYCLVVSACTSCSLQSLPTFLSVFRRSCDEDEVYRLGMSLLMALVHALDHVYTRGPLPVSHNCIIPSNVYICPTSSGTVEVTPFLFNFLPAPAGSDSQSQSDESSHQADLYAIAMLVLSVIVDDDSLSEQYAYASDIDNITINDLVSYLLANSFINNQPFGMLDPRLYSIISRMLHPIKSHRFPNARYILSLLSSFSTERPFLSQFTPAQKSMETLDNLCSERDVAARTLRIHRAPNGTTWSTITGATFAIGWSVLSLSMAFSPAATVMSRIISTGFALAGFPIAKSAWTQRDFESRLYFTYCTLDERILIHRIDSVKSDRVYSVDLIFSPKLRASITMMPSNSARDELVTPALLLSDGIQTHLLSSLGLSYRQMEWITAQINAFTQSCTNIQSI